MAAKSADSTYSDDGKPAAIFDATEDCRTSFHRCLASKELMVDEWAENRLADFNLWAAGLGASAKPEVSLDTRLINDPGAREVVIGLLLILKAYIEQCQRLVTGDGSAQGLDECNADLRHTEDAMLLKEAMDGTKDILEELVILGLAIRKAGKSARYRHADSRFQAEYRKDSGHLKINQKDLVLLEAHLIQVILGRPSEIENSRKQYMMDPDLSNAEQDSDFNEQKVKLDFRKDMLTPVQRHLIIANLKRRNRFIYMRQHGQTLSMHRDSQTSKMGSLGERPVPVRPISKLNEIRSQATRENTPKRKQSRSQEDLRSSPSTGGESRNTRPSEYSQALDLNLPDASRRAFSQITTTARNIEYPPPPLEAKQKRPFRCPCCWQTQSSDSIGDRWKKHLTEDLCPYTCLFPDCPRGFKLYATSESWKAHMNEDHRSAPYWKCFACKKSPNVFAEAERFRSHIKEDHPDIISDDQLPTLAEMYEESDPLDVRSCPLCPWAEEQAWKKHMEEVHNADDYWECCQGSQRFGEEERFISHLKQFHRVVSSGDVEEFVEICRTSDFPSDKSCPLCPWLPGEHMEVDRDSLLNHIAEHIHSFSLYALPWAETNEEEEKAGEKRFRTSVQEVSNWLLNDWSFCPLCACTEEGQQMINPDSLNQVLGGAIPLSSHAIRPAFFLDHIKDHVSSFYQSPLRVIENQREEHSFGQDYFKQYPEMIHDWVSSYGFHKLPAKKDNERSVYHFGKDQYFAEDVEDSQRARLDGEFDHAKSGLIDSMLEALRRQQEQMGVESLSNPMSQQARVKMRLLRRKADSDFELVDFDTGDVPSYAILSHTWTGEEVTYGELSVADKTKTGYDKILFCGERAAADGLEYFWVDTCCIDKRNKTELTQAINSMFRWYRNAAKCYAYLSDVSTSTSDPSAEMCQSAWEAGFRTSRWFTRGWTLQELLAPSSVIFYSSQYKKLGDKSSLARIIHDITGIPIPALDGHGLDTFSAAERIAWAANRQTTRDEDGVYCLLGLLNIFMPVIYGEGKENALKRFQREISRLSVTANTCFNVPFDRNPRFTGRESILDMLDGTLFQGQQTLKMAIVGLGGIGKTELALELVYRTREKYRNCSVFWIPAIDMDSVHKAYRDAAQQLRILGRDEEKADVKKLMQTYLSHADAGPWLCVFDNADDPSMWISSWETKQGSRSLNDYLPKSNQGCIVFTTRDRKTAVNLGGPNIIEVPEMNENGAIQLLQKSLVDSAALSNLRDAKALVKELTYLPLAIVQAAAYINENRIAPTDYLFLLSEQADNIFDLLSTDFEDERRYSSLRNPFLTTWLISFEQIQGRNPLAAGYLSFMACIDPIGIPKWLLPPAPSRKEEIDAIGTLTAYSFIIKRSEAMIFDIHRLVHIAIRSWLQKEGTLSQWNQTAIERLDDLFPDNEYQNRARWRELQPHAAYALRLDSISQDNSRRLELVWKYAKSLSSDGRYREAEVLFKEVFQRRARAFGEEHPATLISMANLASTYRNQGRWKEAEDLEVEVMETSKRVLGEEHPNTLSIMHSLASTYTDQGRWKEAEDLEVEVMETSKRVLGPEHPATLISMANLASTYRNQGRWKEAEDLEVEVMETSKRVLGPEHPDTLISMANLASTYRNQGRLKEAEELEVQVMETSKRVLGEEHPNTLSIMHSLASTYTDQGRWKEAEELEAQVMETSKRVLGEEHPDTLSVKHSLASTYTYQGRWKEAEDLEVQVMETSKRVLGEEHPNTLSIMHSLASTYTDQGRWKEAEELEAQVMETSKRVLGEEHPDTLSVKHSLASTYTYQGRWKEAEDLEVQVMETSKRVLGEEHPNTLRSMYNLAFTWKAQDRNEEAIRLMSACVQQRKQILGVDHPFTLYSIRALDYWIQENANVD